MMGYYGFQIWFFFRSLSAGFSAIEHEDSGLMFGNFIYLINFGSFWLKLHCIWFTYCFGVFGFGDGGWVWLVAENTVETKHWSRPWRGEKNDGAYRFRVWFGLVCFSFRGFLSNQTGHFYFILFVYFIYVYTVLDIWIILRDPVLDVWSWFGVCKHSRFIWFSFFPWMKSPLKGKKNLRNNFIVNLLPPSMSTLLRSVDIKREIFLQNLSGTAFNLEAQFWLSDWEKWF